MIEVGKRKFSDKHIKIICSEFHVNEKWLRTGEGEMFLVSCYDKEFIDIFEKLLPESQDFLVKLQKTLLVTQNKLVKEESPKRIFLTKIKRTEAFYRYDSFLLLFIHV